MNDVSKSIPSIDISGLYSHNKDARQAVAELIRTACEEIGFFSIIGHGVDSDLIRGMQSSVKSFFSQPEEQKKKKVVRPENYRGYIPFAAFSPNSGEGTKDLYEGYKLHWETPLDDRIRKECGCHVRSVHVDLDEFHSRLRVSLRRSNNPDEWMRLGPGATA